VIGHTVSTRSEPERPEFAAALAALRAGDALVFWKSGRWGRSVVHVLTTIGELRDRSVALRSLTEKVLASFANRVAEFRSLSDRARSGACASTQGMDTAATVDAHRIRPWPAANLEYSDTSSRWVSSSACA
jgi:Resolvase, N terminal domain